MKMKSLLTLKVHSIIKKTKQANFILDLVAKKLQYIHKDVFLGEGGGQLAKIILHRKSGEKKLCTTNQRDKIF